MTDDREKAKGAARSVRGFVRDLQTGRLFCPPVNAWASDAAQADAGFRRLMAALTDGKAVCSCTEDRICPACTRRRGLA
jgi:hypothetical protein